MMVGESKGTVKGIIIDSIAAVFRCESGNDLSAIDRSLLFFELASALKQVSITYDVHVLVVNQVTDVFPQDVINVNHWLTSSKLLYKLLFMMKVSQH